MARNVLNVSISTVASESTFSKQVTTHDDDDPLEEAQIRCKDRWTTSHRTILADNSSFSSLKDQEHLEFQSKSFKIQVLVETPSSQ
ncbi:hypothetical protein HAX54_009056, partial [Datura stramonium]|nr:hypothetical protein [Datura stramonium]